jgi:RecB family endonuclease NucS
LERDAELPLLRLEHKITTLLAVRGRLEHCEQLSRYLDGLRDERVLEMGGVL